MGNFFKTATPPATRSYISDGAEAALRAMQSGKKSFSFDIPPRSGKSNLIYLMSVEAMRQYGCVYSIVICPWIFLRDQVCDEEKIQSHIALYDVTENIITSRISSLNNPLFWNIEDPCMRPGIWSTTLSLAYKQQDGLRDAIQATPGRVIVFFDEAHILGDAKLLGTVYDALLELDNVFLVTLTGTLYRRDNRPIKGAIEVPVPEKCKDGGKLTVTRRIDDNRVIRTDYTGVTKTVSEQRADFRVPWSTAWSEGALEKINGLWIDHEVDGKSIASMKMSDIAPGTLRKIMESPKCVGEFAKRTVAELEAAKAHSVSTRNAAAMVVVGSDMADKNGDREVDRHARQVRDALNFEIRSRGLLWDVQIVTMNGDDGGSGVDKMTAFRKDDGCDIIIVKMMGIVGLDVERLKVLSVLSTLRDGPMVAQMLTRPLTVWKKSKGLVPRVIMPADPAMQRAFKEIVTEKGGLATISTMKKEKETIVEDKKEDNSQDVGDSLGVFAHQDQTLSAAQGDHVNDVRIVRLKFPNTSRGQTDVEILKAIAEGAYPVTDVDRQTFKKELENNRPKAINIDAALSGKRGAFNELTKDYANLNFSYASDKDDWVEARIYIAQRAKKEAGIAVEIQHERDAAKLNKAIDYMTKQIREIRMAREAAAGGR